MHKTQQCNTVIIIMIRETESNYNRFYYILKMQLNNKHTHTDLCTRCSNCLIRLIISHLQEKYVSRCAIKLITEINKKKLQVNTLFYGIGQL